MGPTRRRAAASWQGAAAPQARGQQTDRGLGLQVPVQAYCFSGGARPPARARSADFAGAQQGARKDLIAQTQSRPTNYFNTQAVRCDPSSVRGSC